MAWVEFYRIRQPHRDVPDDRALVIGISPSSQTESPPAADSGCGGTPSEPIAIEETTMSNNKALINGHAENGEAEEDYPALAEIVGVDAEAAGRLDEMSAGEVEEFIEEMEDREDTLAEIDRAKKKLLRLANQKRKLKLADEAPRCEHIKSNGQYCGSPAIKGTPLCYFHGETRKLRESEAAAKAADLPVLEDMHSLQLAVMRVCGLLASKAIEEKTARVLFDGLRLAQKTLAENGL